MDVGMRVVFGFPAGRTGVTAIGGRPAGGNGFPAIQGFGQGTGKGFQFLELIAGEQVSMAEPSTRERALEQFDALRLFSEMPEGHVCFPVEACPDAGFHNRLPPPLCFPRSGGQTKFYEA